MVFDKRLLTGVLVILAVLSSLATGHSALAQTSNTSAMQWEKYYNQSNACDAIRFIAESSDGGYVLLAPKNHRYTSPSALEMLKVDESGNVQWEKLFNSSGEHSADVGGLVQTSDQGYVFTFGAGGAVELIKVDSNGEKQWKQTYPYEYASSIVQTADGGFALACSKLGENYLSNLWLVKTDSQGNLQWSKTVQQQYAGISQLIQTRDGNFMVIGYTYDPNATEIYTSAADLLLQKISSSGSLIWTKTYNSGHSIWGDKRVVQTGDGGYVLTDTGAAVVLKTDSEGTVQWTNSYNVSGRYSSSHSAPATLNDVIVTSDGGLAFAGTSSCGEVWVLKTDSSGNTEWNQTYGDRDRYGYQGVCIIESSDGNLLVGGSWQSTSRGGVFYLLKIEASLPLPTASPTLPLASPLLPSTVIAAMTILLVATAILIALKRGQKHRSASLKETGE